MTNVSSNKKINTINNRISLIFFKFVSSYVFSDIGSEKEEMIINEICSRYSTLFRYGSIELASHYLNAFFYELGKRKNAKHIYKIKELFGYDKKVKVSSSAYKRFLINVSKGLKDSKL